MAIPHCVLHLFHELASNQLLTKKGAKNEFSLAGVELCKKRREIRILHQRVTHFLV